MNLPRVLCIALLALSVAASGCLDLFEGDEEARPLPTYRGMGFDGTHWPRLDGQTITILDHGAFGAFSEAKKRFENLTGARVEHVPAADTGAAFNRAILERGSPTFDVLYGVDNILLKKAESEGIFEPYKPLLANRVKEEYVFFGADNAWLATPTDFGFIALNVDENHSAIRNIPNGVDTLQEVRDHANLFVTQDPRTSTPGLGFLLATIATFGTESQYDWKDYWTDLFENGVLVTADWSTAYEQHFSAGYNSPPSGAGLGDRPIVTSYTTSPAYEHFYGRPASELAEVLTESRSTFRQIETMGIAKGTKHLAAAQAWIEFTLTDAFQNLTAPNMAVYPVVAGIRVNDTFGGLDPAPGTFEPVPFTYATIGQNIERWVDEWNDLCEAHNCA